MSKLIILGSSNAIATEGHENTHMVIVGQEKTVLVDCVSSPIVRLEQAGVDFQALTDVVLTHFHPDHVSGVPLLLMSMWLLGRRSPLNIHGLPHTLERVEGLMGFYGWSEWSKFFPVSFRRIPAKEMTLVLESEDFRVLSSPVRHLIPTIGIRLEFSRSARVLAYSCDTEPCPEVLRLAAGADVLIHEAAGRGRGHSSVEQAAEVASQAEVGKLLLIHYPTGRHATGDLLREARERFQGEVSLAQDFMELEMG
ncbi:MAG: MBL fold metallo-hydrolase [Chloroflexota bacterium]